MRKIVTAAAVFSALLAADLASAFGLQQASDLMDDAFVECYRSPYDGTAGRLGAVCGDQPARLHGNIASMHTGTIGGIADFYASDPKVDAFCVWAVGSGQYAVQTASCGSRKHKAVPTPPAEIDEWDIDDWELGPL